MRSNAFRKTAVFVAAALVTGSVAGAAGRQSGLQERRPRLRRSPRTCASTRSRVPRIPIQFARTARSRDSGQFHRRGAQRCGAERRRAAAGRLFTSKDFYKDRELWTDPRYFRCNSPVALEEQCGANSSGVIGDNPPASAAWGHCDRDYPREGIVSPYPFKTAQEHYEALLAETKKRGGASKNPTRRAARGLDRPLHASRQHDRRAGRLDGPRQGHEPAVLLVPHAAQPDDDDPVVADARVSEAHGPGGLSPGQHERAAVAVAVLLARRLHAPLARVRRLGVAHHRRAVGRADRDRRRAQLHHDDPRRPRVQAGRHRAALGPGRPALVRRDDRLLGRRHDDHLDVEHPGLEGARRVRVLEQDADDRDLHAEPRRVRQVPRPQPRSDLLRPRGARGAGPHRPQLRENERLTRKATRTSSSTACRRSSRSRAGRRRSRRARSSSTKYPICTAVLGPRYWEEYWEKGMEKPEGEDIFSFD